MSTEEAHCVEVKEEVDEDDEGFPFGDLGDFEVVDEVDQPDEEGEEDENVQEEERVEEEDSNHGDAEDTSQLDESHEQEDGVEVKEDVDSEHEQADDDAILEQDDVTDVVMETTTDGGEEEEEEEVEDIEEDGNDDEAVVLDASNVADTLEGDNEELLEGEEEEEELQDEEENEEEEVEEEEMGEEEAVEEEAEPEDGGEEVEEACEEEEEIKEVPYPDEIKWNTSLTRSMKKKRVKRETNIRKSVIVRPVRGNDVGELLKHPCFKMANCFNFRFLGGPGGVKNGHLEVRFVTEREAVDQADALSAIVLETGRKFKVSRIGPGLGPMDGFLDQWQKSVSPEGIFDSRCVFVNNVPSEGREEMLRALYPMAQSIHLPRSADGKSQGYAMLEFESQTAAEDIVTYSHECSTRIGNNILKLNILGHTKKDADTALDEETEVSKPEQQTVMKNKVKQPAPAPKGKGKAVPSKPSPSIKQGSKEDNKSVPPIKKNGKGITKSIQPIKKDGKENAKPIQPIKPADKGNLKPAPTMKQNDAKANNKPVQSSVKKPEVPKSGPAVTLVKAQTSDPKSRSASQTGGSNKHTDHGSSAHNSKSKGHQSGSRSADFKRDSKTDHTGSKSSSDNQRKGGVRSVDTRSGTSSRYGGGNSTSKTDSGGKGGDQSRRSGSSRRNERSNRRSRSGSRSNWSKSDASRKSGAGDAVNPSKTKKPVATARTAGNPSNQTSIKPTGVIQTPGNFNPVRAKPGTTIPVQLGRKGNLQKRPNDGVGGPPDLGPMGPKRSRADDRPPPGPNIRPPPRGMPPGGGMGNVRMGGGYGGPPGYPMSNRNVPQQGFKRPPPSNMMANQMQSNVMSLNQPLPQNMANPLQALPNMGMAQTSMRTQQMSRPMRVPGSGMGDVRSGQIIDQMAPRHMDGVQMTSAPYIPTSQSMMSSTAMRNPIQDVRGQTALGPVNTPTQQSFGMDNRGPTNWSTINPGNQTQPLKWDDPLSRAAEQRPDDLRNLRGELLKQLQVLEQGNVSDPTLLNNIAQKLKQVQDNQSPAQLQPSQTGYQQQQQGFQPFSNQQTTFQQPAVQQQSTGYQQQQQQMGYQQQQMSQQQQQQQQYRSWQGQGQMVTMTSPSNQLAVPVNVQSQPVARSGYSDLPTNQLGYQSYTSSNQSDIVDSYRTSQGRFGSSLSSAKMAVREERDSMSPDRVRSEIYVGNFPTGVPFEETKRFFDEQMERRGLCPPGACPTIFISNNRKDFTFIRFSSEEFATRALQLDGIAFKAHILNISRPALYQP